MVNWTRSLTLIVIIAGALSAQAFSGFAFWRSRPTTATFQFIGATMGEGTNNISLALPSGTTTGDLLVFTSVSGGNSATIPAPTGFTSLGGGVVLGGTDTIYRMGWKIVSATETNPVVSTGPGFNRVAMLVALRGPQSIKSAAQVKYSTTGAVNWTTTLSTNPEFYVFIVQPRPPPLFGGTPTNPLGFDANDVAPSGVYQQSWGVYFEPTGSSGRTLSWTIPPDDGHYFQIIAAP